MVLRYTYLENTQMKPRAGQLVQIKIKNGKKCLSNFFLLLAAIAHTSYYCNWINLNAFVKARKFVKKY